MRATVCAPRVAPLFTCDPALWALKYVVGAKRLFQPAFQDGDPLVTCRPQDAIGRRAARGGAGGAGRGPAPAATVCLRVLARPREPPPALRAPAAPNVVNQNVGLVPSGRRGQFLKGQPAGEHSCILRRPSLRPGLGGGRQQAREGAGASPSAPRIANKGARVWSDGCR